MGIALVRVETAPAGRAAIRARVAPGAPSYTSYLAVIGPPRVFFRARTGIPVVVVANSVGGQPEATDYISLMDLIVKRCAAAARGK